MELTQATLTIRTMVASDIHQVSQIEAENYIDPWNAKIFADCLQVGYQCVVLLCEEVIIGYCIVMHVLEEAHLLNIAISQQSQNQGLGFYFLQHLIHDMQQDGSKLIYLEVRQSNIYAQKLYEKLGFNIVGKRKGYYPLGNGREDAILYTKYL
tara:strand:- start:150 stop:608 length:459 start_codon:yes stop_codon:yes gene_type:complete